MGPSPSQMPPFTSPGPLFPPEITDSIIHELSPNRPALRICSLVCRTWLPASRYILHDTLSLRGWDVPGFLDIIVPSENTYLGTLRAIDIRLCENGPVTSLLRLLPQFVCLKSIRIQYSTFDYQFPVIPAVNTLEFFGAQFPSFTAFTNLLDQCPNLKNLKLETISWGSVDGSAPPGIDMLPGKSSTRLELDTFSVDISNDSPFLDWISSPESAPLTSNLTLLLHTGLSYTTKDPLEAEIIKKAQQYCRHLNLHLKHLHVRFDSAGA